MVAESRRRGINGSFLRKTWRLNVSLILKSSAHTLEFFLLTRCFKLPISFSERISFMIVSAKVPEGTAPVGLHFRLSQMRNAKEII